jgi:ribosome biogenesis GTPase
VFAISAKHGQGMDALRAGLAGLKVVLSGSSGVGKSSLIRALIPGALPGVGDVRKGEGKGRHTTTSSNLYQAGEFTIIDTPGIRELGVRGVPKREFAEYWRDFKPFLGQCRFRDCMHMNEPDCAILQAVAEGKLPDFRYQSYLRILDDLED